MENKNSNSLLARYYKFMFNGKLPEYTCTLYRNTLFSIILFPIAIFAAFPLWKDEAWDNKSLFKKSVNGFLTVVLSLLISAVGLGFLKENDITFWKELPFLLAYALGLLAILSLILIISIIIIVFVGMFEGSRFLISEFGEYINEKKDSIKSNEKKDSKIKVIWDTLKNKYCTKINWK